MLEAVGVTAQDEATYLELVRRGSATLAELAARTGLPEAQTAQVVDSLHRQGLVHRTPAPRELVVPVPPELAVESLLRRRHDELDRVREAAQQLAAEYRHRPSDRRTEELIEIVPGRSGVLHAFERVQRAARHEVRVFVAPPFAASYRVNQTQLAREADGVVYRAVYGPEALEESGFLAGLSAHVRAGEQARLAATVPIKLAIADRTLALLPLAWTGAAQDSAMLVHPCGLLDALTALFESVWAAATPLTVGPDGGAWPEEIPAADRTLLALLAAGLTDEAAGARLNLSRRTVVRRVRALMAATGSRSRLQLGWRARERGWL